MLNGFDLGQDAQKSFDHQRVEHPPRLFVDIGDRLLVAPGRLIGPGRGQGVKDVAD